MPTTRKLVHCTLIPIRWGDMDAYGHVNNTIYFRYMEQARVEYLQKSGCPAIPRGDAPVIINASCTFLIPLNYPGVVEVRMYCGQPGRSSVPTHYELRLQGDAETLYATGDAKMVWMNVDSGKSVPIPAHLRADLTATDD
ncbi:MAG TPA: thioesterase family protein [Accumulibacter sp.]|jgi:acyl-CoA thioester hydrolase|nr:thioesterase family protein [Accumulibacter sp.]